MSHVPGLLERKRQLQAQLAVVEEALTAEPAWSDLLYCDNRPDFERWLRHMTANQQQRVLALVKEICS